MIVLHKGVFVERADEISTHASKQEWPLATLQYWSFPFYQNKVFPSDELGESEETNEGESI